MSFAFVRDASGDCVRRIAGVLRPLLLYVCLAAVVGFGVYWLTPATLFVGEDHMRPIALSYGGMHRKELYYSEREASMHQGDAAWLRSNDERWAPVRRRVRDERSAYVGDWLLLTGAGGALIVVCWLMVVRRMRSRRRVGA